MPVALTKKYTSLGEFEDWQVYFSMRMEKREKADWHTALICDTFARVMGAKGTKLQDHMLVFENPATKKEESLEMHQAKWFVCVGLVPEE